MKFSRHPFGLIATISVASFVTPVAFGQASVLEANRNVVSSGAPAQPPGARKARRLSVDAFASIGFGNGALVTVSSHQGGFDRVGLRHDQTVDIKVQYPAARAGEAIAVEAVDGGQVIATGKGLTVGADGTIRFKFRAGHKPGTYQIVCRKEGKELGLRFWVRDDEHPRNNPPVITAGN